MDTKAFEVELLALLKKYDLTLFPTPTYIQTSDGIWHTSAEIKVMPAPVKEVIKTIE